MTSTNTKRRVLIVGNPASQHVGAHLLAGRANIGDLERHGCRAVRYLPFAYNPQAHFTERASSDVERERFECDIAFIGGADPERVAVMTPILAAGFKTHLYGGYWDRYAIARA